MTTTLTFNVAVVQSLLTLLSLLLLLVLLPVSTFLQQVLLLVSTSNVVSLVSPLERNYSNP